MAKSLSDALEIVVRTEQGIVRGHNEDAVFANPNIGLAILADGMGGYNAGEVASGMATMCLSSELEADFSAKHPCAIDPVSGETHARTNEKRCRPPFCANGRPVLQCAQTPSPLVSRKSWQNAHRGG